MGMATMKILMSSCYFDTLGDPYRIGGIQRHITLITEALRRAGHKVRWTYKFQDRCRPAELQTNIAWADVIFSHGWFSFLHGAGKRQIIVAHGWEGKCPPDPETVKVRQEISAQADAVIHVGYHIEKWYGIKPDAVIWGGATIPSGKLPDPIWPAVYIGRLAPDTCPHMVFEAAEALGFRLPIFAEGELRGELQERFPEHDYYGFTRRLERKIPLGKIVFCSGYLTMLEVAMRRRLIVSFYDTEIRRDIIDNIPLHVLYGASSADVVKLIRNISARSREHFLDENLAFARTQTWDRVAEIYIQFAGNTHEHRNGRVAFPAKG